MGSQLVTVVATHRGENIRNISARSVRHDEARRYRAGSSAG
jgi:uncharacterized DUF497 family protein